MALPAPSVKCRLVHFSVQANVALSFDRIGVEDAPPHLSEVHAMNKAL